MQDSENSIHVLFATGKTGLSVKDAVLEVANGRLTLKLAPNIDSATPTMFDIAINDISKVVFARGSCLIYMNDKTRHALGTAHGKNATLAQLKAWLKDEAHVSAPIKTWGLSAKGYVIYLVVFAIIVIFILHSQNII